jgi:hypothetical protein
MYWLLITHSVFLLPMFMCYYSYYKNKTYQSLYMGMQFLYIIIFSCLYHTYDYDNIKIDTFTYKIVRILDHWLSCSVIFTNLTYFLRMRTEIFYILSNIISTFYLVIVLINNSYTMETVWICSIFIVLYRYKRLLLYIKEQPYNLILLICSVITSVVFFFTALQQNYELYHSLWHSFIAITAFLASYLRYKADKKYLLELPFNTRERVATESM